MVSRAPHRAKAPAVRARSGLPAPSWREMTVPPPMPKRLLSAVMLICTGKARARAASWLGSFSRPTQKLSARL